MNDLQVLIMFAQPVSGVLHIFADMPVTVLELGKDSTGGLEPAVEFVVNIGRSHYYYAVAVVGVGVS